MLVKISVSSHCVNSDELLTNEEYSQIGKEALFYQDYDFDKIIERHRTFLEKLVGF